MADSPAKKIVLDIPVEELDDSPQGGSESNVPVRRVPGMVTLNNIRRGFLSTPDPEPKADPDPGLDLEIEEKTLTDTRPAPPKAPEPKALAPAPIPVPPSRPKAVVAVPPPVAEPEPVTQISKTLETQETEGRPQIDLGLLSAYMRDAAVTEIMVNDLRNIILEKDGKLIPSGVAFGNVQEIYQIIRNIQESVGRVITPDEPYLDTILPDGSRANIVIPPVAVNGPSLTIRKFPAKSLTVKDLMASEMMDRRIAYFLNVCVVGKINILVSGGTDSGKTTLLNVLGGFVPKGERIVLIEDTPELAINHPNSVRLQTKPATSEKPAITTRDLVANSLRMRPDRVIVGECRRAEAFDMLQAMNTGHSGSMTTLHANSPRDALSRLETLCLMSGVDLPLSAIRRQIGSALDLIVQIKRFRNGKRRIVAISEVTGLEGDTITLQDIFTFEMEAKAGTASGPVGLFKCTGLVPTFLDRLRDQGIDLPRNYFV